ncbi:MAG: SUMF1/EgtB/PvdO family nonheme iron enzyme [Bacteroidota bacterium]
MVKYFICIISLLFSTLTLLGARPGNVEPVKIEPITKVTYDHSFYAEQAEAWKEQTVNGTNVADAWLNYYKAARYANIFADSLSKKYDLDAIVGNMPTSMANTFEFNYILYAHENDLTAKYEHLLKAHEIAPERLDSYHSMINYYVVKGDNEQIAKYGKALFEAGEFSPSLMAWNYNVLASVEKNAILLTHGDNDTYPAWVLQKVKDTRKDVEVINISFLMYDEYRERVFSELGIIPLSSEDYPGYQDMYLAIARRFALQADRPVYFATSIPQFIRKELGDSLYLVGMAFKYSETPFDNVAFLKNNFENKFLKDHLRIQLEPDTGSNVIANMNMHYLPAIITLRKHYVDSGESGKAGDLVPLIRRIAKKAGKEAYISHYLGETDPDNKEFVTGISARSLQKEMVAVRKNLYAGATEVTNEQYDAFLMDLLKNKEYELLDKCKAPKTNWRSLLPDKYQHLPDDQLFWNGGHPDDGRAPVQNISHEAAVEYCKWITRVYNNSTDKKKEYGQVKFRLPSEEEWEFAAHGGGTTPYPWGGFYYRNAKGCFLFNTEVSNEEPCKDCSDKAKTPDRDGGFFPVVGNAYFPNDFGLYNCSGNVAEMIAVKGVAKGGSWEDHPDDSKIMSVKKYSAPSPAIGFRVFMEVK